MRTNLDNFGTREDPIDVEACMKGIGSQFRLLVLSSTTAMAPFCQNALAQTSAPITGQSKEILARPASQSKDLMFSWNFDLKGSQLSSDVAKNTGAKFNLRSSVHYFLLEDLSLTVAPRFSYQTGYYQNVYSSQPRSSEISVTEAQATLEFPHSFGKTGFSLGALNEENFHSSLLLDDRAFPGIRVFENLTFRKGEHLNFVAEASVPTAAGLSTETRDFEKTPSFLSLGIQSKIQLGRWGFALDGGYFEYQNLPITIATESGQFGNSVEKFNSTDSIFRYKYRGYEMQAKLDVDITRSFSYRASVEAVQNLGAPEQNKGYKMRSDLPFQLGRRWVLVPTYEYFHIEPDAMVAAYNSNNYEANRVGYKTGLRVERSKIFRVSFLAGERDVLFLSPTQVRESTVELVMETLNDML